MRAEERSGSLLAAPYTAFLLLFAAYPIGFALVLVFLQWDLVRSCFKTRHASRFNSR
jgi:ABC-type sugar transport system permease subunit